VLISEGEGFLMVGSFVVSVWTTITWFLALGSPIRFQRGPARWPVMLAPFAGWAAIWVVLHHFASADVRNEPTYIWLYFLFGIAWLGVALKVLPWWGLSARDDVGEQQNPAAIPAMMGAALGISACYAGANIGDGPGWWCVLWAGALATASWFLSLWVVGHYGQLVEHVTVERDTGAGIRLGAFLLAAGIICGRGAAGDWTDAMQTVAEFAAAWSLAPLVLVVLYVEHRLRPTPHRPASPLGISCVVSALFIVIAIGGVVAAGPLPDGYQFPSAQGQP
jgi:hypothetical protein